MENFIKEQLEITQTLQKVAYETGYLAGLRDGKRIKVENLGRGSLGGICMCHQCQLRRGDENPRNSTSSDKNEEKTRY